MEFISGIANVGRTLADALGLSATTTAARAHVVEETPNNSDSSEDEDQHSTANTAFVFKVEGQLISTNQNATTKEEYLDSVLSWSSVGFLGRLRIDRIEPSFSSSSNPLSCILCQIWHSFARYSRMVGLLSSVNSGRNVMLVECFHAPFCFAAYSIC
jgi:hypothetical protein